MPKVIRGVENGAKMRVLCNGCGFSAELRQPPGPGEPVLCPRCRSAIHLGREEAEAASPGQPAWENRESLLDLAAMASTVKGALLSPTRVFSGLAPKTGYRAAILFFILTVMVGAVGYLFAQQVMAAATGRDLATPVEVAVKVAALLFALPVLAPSMALVISGLIHAGLTIVRGSKGGFASTFRVFAYVGGATSLFNVVPVLGPVAGFVWGIASQVLGLKAAHSTSYARAILGMVLGLVIFFGIIVGAATALGLGMVGLMELLE